MSRAWESLCGQSKYSLSNTKEKGIVGNLYISLTYKLLPPTELFDMCNAMGEHKFQTSLVLTWLVASKRARSASILSLRALPPVLECPLEAAASESEPWACAGLEPLLLPSPRPSSPIRLQAMSSQNIVSGSGTVIICTDPHPSIKTLTSKSWFLQFCDFLTICYHWRIPTVPVMYTCGK